MEDIKIADFSEKPEPKDDSESIISTLYRQKQNGNLDKARLLGDRLAEQVAADDGEFAFGVDEKENTVLLLHRRLLLAFAVAQGMKLFLPNSIVEKTALNGFLEHLKKIAPHIYVDLKDNGDFSFYTLCSRESESADACIGETFAELIGKEGDQAYIDLGQALYLHFLDLAAHEAKSLAFQT